MDYFDAAYPGLALRVTGAVDQRPERRTWTLFYRFGGKQRRMTFEPGYPALGLADARDAANKAKLAIQAGVDPGAAKAEAKAEAARAPDTIANVVAMFIRRDLEGKEAGAAIHCRDAAHFRQPRVAALGRPRHRHDHPPRCDRTPRRGDGQRERPQRRQEATKAAGRSDHREPRACAQFAPCSTGPFAGGSSSSTPAALVERPGEETRRDRTLKAEEIRALWPRFAALEYPFGPFFQMALATGQRREEVARMRWADVDIGAQLWTLPAEATKAARGHAVPLSPLAMALLEGLPKLGTYVFTTTRDRPISGFSKAKARLDAMGKSDGASASRGPLDDPRFAAHRRNRDGPPGRVAVHHRQGAEPCRPFCNRNL